MWRLEFYCRLCYTYKSKTKVSKQTFVKSLTFILEGFLGLKIPKNLSKSKKIPVGFSKSQNLVHLFRSDTPLVHIPLLLFAERSLQHLQLFSVAIPTYMCIISH